MKRTVSLLTARAAVLVLVTAGAAVGVAGPPASASSGSGHHDQRIRIATYNTAATQRTARAVADITELGSRRTDVIALQEMSSAKRRRGVLAALVTCHRCRFGAWMPRSAVPGESPVLYRKDRFTLVGGDTVKVSGAKYVGKRGAGPARLRAKYVNVVKLRAHRSGRMVYVLNSHAVPTVQGHGGGANHRLPARLALYRKHMRGLKELVRRYRSTGAAVFVTGDFNVNYRRDRIVQDPLFPYVNMRSVGVGASYRALGEPKRGTHVLRSGRSTRLIDYVMYLRHRQTQPVRQKVLLGFHSDHRPLWVKFRLGAMSVDHD